MPVPVGQQYHLSALPASLSLPLSATLPTVPVASLQVFVFVFTLYLYFYCIQIFVLAADGPKHPRHSVELGVKLADSSPSELLPLPGGCGVNDST